MFISKNLSTVSQVYKGELLQHTRQTKQCLVFTPRLDAHRPEDCALGVHGFVKDSARAFRKSEMHEKCYDVEHTVA